MIKPLRWYERLWCRIQRWDHTIVAVCDRCKKRVLTRSHGDGLTAGYYHDWPHMMNPGEIDVCDACMWADPRYQVAYGDRAT